MEAAGLVKLDIPDRLRKMQQQVRILGREFLRPMGVEADRTGEPTPPDHPFYFKFAELGLQGRTRTASGQSEGERWSARTACIIGEEASYWDRGVAVTLPGPGMSASPIINMGTDEQKRRYIDMFKDRSKPLWGAFAMTEPGAGSDVAAIRTRCDRRGDGWVIDGAKAFCSNADRASWILVWATVDVALGRQGHRAFVIERGTKGMEVTRNEKKMGLTAYASCSLSLDNCELPADALLGGEEHYQTKRGFKEAMKAFDATRPLVAVMAIGIGRAAFDRARDFVRDNYDLGRPIPRYAKIREKLARIRRRLDAGRLLCWKAAWLADQQKPNTLEASIAKAYCPPAALEAVSACVDILGDAGVRNDHLVEKLYRDVKALDIVEGTGQIQRRIIARKIAGYPYQ